MLLLIMQERKCNDMVELKAFFGILYLLGVSKGNHESIRNLWSDGLMARHVFKATMSVNRFEIFAASEI